MNIGVGVYGVFVWCLVCFQPCFVGHCSVHLFLGFIVLVVCPFHIAYWLVSMGTFDGIVFGVFIWCLVSF